MKIEIFTIILLICEAIVLFYKLGNIYNENFANKSYQIKKNIVDKLGLDINVENKKGPLNIFVWIPIFIISSLLNTKMIFIILYVGLMLFILKLNMPYEKFEKVFSKKNPTKKKYNLYLFSLLTFDIILVLIAIFSLQ